MRTILVCVLLLFLACGGMCTDSDDKWKSTEGQLLTSLVTLKYGPFCLRTSPWTVFSPNHAATVCKHHVSKLGAPYWRTILLNVCGLLSRLGQDAWLSAEEELVTRGRPNATKTLELLQSLQTLCVSVQPWKRVENRDVAPRRRWPYILKRQLGSNGRRRPYILKRTVGD
nr:neurotensin/neuromedin N isoform X1 [Paramormyrops kingsleyae]